jgi:hypothetical protein
MHVNGAFAEGVAETSPHKQASDLHLPTDRVGLELVLWHLLAEWGVAAKTGDWREVLRASLEGFRERRTAP